MAAKHVGCLKASDCICQGTEYINNPDQKNALVADLLPCPGPTEPQFGHIRKNRRLKEEENAKNLKLMEESVASILDGFETGLDFLNDPNYRYLHGRYAIAGLIDVVRSMSQDVRRIDDLARTAELQRKCVSGATIYGFVAEKGQTIREAMDNLAPKG